MVKQDPKDRQTRVTTTGGSVRITQPTSRTRKRSKAAVVVDVITPPAVDGFVGFLREHAVVGLAVGLVIGTQLKNIVDSLNTGFISPLFGLLFGGASLINRATNVHWHGRVASLAWGKVIYQLVDFIFVMAVLYAVIKTFKLDKLDQPKS
jgi:large-conductance mechanosensitive channel